MRSFLSVPTATTYIHAAIVFLCSLVLYKRKHSSTMHNIEIVCLELVYVSGGNEGLLVVQMGESQLVKIVHGHGET